jgi:hypothetical protein
VTPAFGEGLPVDWSRSNRRRGRSRELPAQLLQGLLASERAQYCCRFIHMSPPIPRPTMQPVACRGLPLDWCFKHWGELTQLELILKWVQTLAYKFCCLRLCGCIPSLG